MIAKNIRIVKNQFKMIPDTHRLFVEVSDFYKQNMNIYTSNEANPEPLELSFNPMKIAEMQMILEIVINLNQKFPDSVFYLYEHRDYEFKEFESGDCHDHILLDNGYDTWYQLFIPKELINRDLLSVLSDLSYFMD